MAPTEISSTSATGQPLAVRLLSLAQRGAGLLNRLSETLISALFMGLIDDEEFQKWDVYPHQGSSGPDDLLNGMAEGFQPWEKQVFEAAGSPKSGKALVIGAGGGRESVALSREGLEVDGIEYCSELAEYTQSALEQESIDISVTSPDRFEVPGEKGTYDAVFIGRYYFSYIHDRNERIEFLESLREVLRDDAVVMFSYFDRPEDPSSNLARLFRVQTPIANFLRKIRGKGAQHVEVGDHLDPNTPVFHHHFIRSEIESELKGAGFSATEHGFFTYGGWTVASPKS